MVEKKFVRATQIRPGNYILIDGAVCQVRDLETSKPGKHGASKARITAIDVFDGQKRNLMQPGTDDVEVPIVDKGNAQVVAVMGETIQIMDLETYQTYEIPKPKDVPLQQGDEVEYIKADENIKVVRKR